MLPDYPPPATRLPAFCPMCAGRLQEREVEGESRPRLVCEHCGYIFYLNPKVVAATIPVLDGQLLLARRAIEPRKGCWTFPSGFVELGESVEEGAIRETYEEILVRVELRDLLNVYSRARVGIVVVVFHAEVVEGEGSPGPESLEVARFTPEAIPWDELAFDSTTSALRDWVEYWNRLQRASRLPAAPKRP